MAQFFLMLQDQGIDSCQRRDHQGGSLVKNSFLWGNKGGGSPLDMSLEPDLPVCLKSLSTCELPELKNELMW